MLQKQFLQPEKQTTHKKVPLILTKEMPPAAEPPTVLPLKQADLKIRNQTPEILTG